MRPSINNHNVQQGNAAVKRVCPESAPAAARTLRIRTCRSQRVATRSRGGTLRRPVEDVQREGGAVFAPGRELRWMRRVACRSRNLRRKPRRRHSKAGTLRGSTVAGGRSRLRGTMATSPAHSCALAVASWTWGRVAASSSYLSGTTCRSSCWPPRRIRRTSTWGAAALHRSASRSSAFPRRLCITFHPRMRCIACPRRTAHSTSCSAATRD